jgi:hypothetical protein
MRESYSEVLARHAGSASRTDLCGGRLVTAVPTAIPGRQKKGRKGIQGGARKKVPRPKRG